jgi:hypothetical protein
MLFAASVLRAEVKEQSTTETIHVVAKHGADPVSGRTILRKTNNLQ